VVGAVATMGLVVGSDVPMFLGAMIVGPSTALLLKYFDKLVEDKIKPGFEMLVENFSAGIVGGGMAVLGVWIIGPVVRAGTRAAGNAVEYLVHHHLLPLASVLIEPAKVLFLNNAINHGVLGPLGVAESAQHGKSILFMLESNPGPGLGVLLAYLLFGPKLLRPTVPAAIVIQFLGGIHEIYFPYVLMKPRMILAAIAGGASGILVFLVTHAGLVATPSPGSIFAYAAETPRGGWFGVFAGVLVAAGVSFTVGSMLLGFGRLAEEPEVSEVSAEDDGEAPAEDAGTDTESAPAGVTRTEA
jgi:PTS system mannitol-specific IIC component